MIRVKICGITTLDDAHMCAEAGADMLGFNFYPKSPRYIAPEAAGQIASDLRQVLGEQCPFLVGVFVNETADAVLEMMEVARVDFAQLSGDEPVEALADLQGIAIKAIRPRSFTESLDITANYLPFAPSDGRLPSLLVDAYHKDLYGGTGEQANIEVALAAMTLAPRLMLAGGLTPENITARLRAIQPWGVDIASGVENGQPGIKDRDRVQNLVASVRAVEHELRD